MINNRTRPVVIGVACLLLLGFTRPVAAQATGSAGEAQGILKASGKHGGLALVLGIQQLELARELAAASKLYVHVLQPDKAKSVAWGREVATAEVREAMGIRHAGFVPDHYGSNLFNLIVVDDAEGLNGADLKNVKRILVPRGVLAVRNPETGIEAGIRKAGLQPTDSPAGAFRLFAKSAEKPAFAPANSLKWRSGPRAHISVGIYGPTIGDGRYVYRELMEAEGAFGKGRTQLFVRDAFNGRILWTREEPVGVAQWKFRHVKNRSHNFALAADEQGRLFMYTFEGKLVCVDAETGKLRFELESSGTKPDYIRVHNDRFVLTRQTVYSAEDGKKLWQWKGAFTVLHDDVLVESDGNVIWIRDLATGRERAQAKLDWRDTRKYKKLDLVHAGSHILVTEGDRRVRPFQVTALDAKTGKKVWTHALGGAFALPFAVKSDDSFRGEPGYACMGDKLIVYAHTGYYHDRKDKKEVHLTRIDLATGKVEQEDYGIEARLFGNACATHKAQQFGDYLFYHHNVWFNLKTLERTFPYLVHPNCFLPPPAGHGMVFNAPGRKGFGVEGMSAVGPADLDFGNGKGLPGADAKPKPVVHTKRPAFSEPTTASDWPMFRANIARSNFVAANPGIGLKQIWSVTLGQGGESYGVMKSVRTGLTQPVTAYGLVVVADMAGQRIVALDQAKGETVWTFHTGSRVDFSPALYKGLCVFTAKDGFVYCLNVKTGALVYRLQVSPRERYIGGQEKLENLWPTAADVMIRDGVGHASAGFASTIHGGVFEITFNVETGEVLTQKHHHQPYSPTGHPAPSHFTDMQSFPLQAGGKQLDSHQPMDNMLGYGNSISRTNEVRAERLFSDGPYGNRRVKGRCIAFDDHITVVYTFEPKVQDFYNKGPLHLKAFKTWNEKRWSTPPIEFVVDDIVLTPGHIYCAGHYQRVNKQPELRVISRTDGSLLQAVPIEGFPSFFGMAATGKRLFLSTREGKLICFEGK